MNDLTIYVAGPYTKGDVAVNVFNALRFADYLMRQNVTPFVPHLTHFWHIMHPHTYEEWCKYDLVWMLKCDGILRIAGESAGADKEWDVAMESNIPGIVVQSFNLQDLKHLDTWIETLRHIQNRPIGVFGPV